METKDILKQLRKDNGYNSAQDFCKAADISINTYQNYETGKRIPTAEMLIKLADFYDVSTDYLLGREPKENPIAMLNLAIAEKEAMEKYAELPEEIKKIILNTMIQLSEATKNAREKDNPKLSVTSVAGVHEDAMEKEIENQIAKQDVG